MKYEHNDATRLLEGNRAKFRVLRADEGFAKSDGGEYIKLFCRLTSPEGYKGQATAYLKTVDQIKQFLDSIGASNKFESNHLDTRDCLDKEGECVIKIEISKDYPDKNSIVRFIVPKTDKHDLPFNDDISL